MSFFGDGNPISEEDNLWLKKNGIMFQNLGSSFEDLLGDDIKTPSLLGISCEECRLTN